MHTCDLCGSDAPTQHVTFHQNVGLIVLRFGSRVSGYLCRPCIDSAFWRTSLISFFFGWWGVISFFITLFTLPINVATYIGALSLPRSHRGDALPRTNARLRSARGVATADDAGRDAGRAYPAAHRDQSQVGGVRRGVHPALLITGGIVGVSSLCGCGLFGLVSWVASLPPPPPRQDPVLVVAAPTAPALVLGGDLDVGTTIPSEPILRYGVTRGERMVEIDGEECAGEIPNASAHALIVGAELPLRVIATSPGGTSLVIERPDGTLICGYDRETSSGIIDATFAPGTYRVFVGSFGPEHPYALAVSAPRALSAAGLRPPHRVVIASVEFPPSKPDGRPWDVLQGAPDILVQVRQDGALIVERFLGQDTYQSYESLTLPSLVIVSRDHPLEIRVIDRDPAVPDDAGSVLIDDLEEHATRYAYFETSSGVSLQLEVDLAD